MNVINFKEIFLDQSLSNRIKNKKKKEGKLGRKLDVEEMVFSPTLFLTVKTN